MWMPENILTQTWFSIASVVSGIIFTVRVPTAVTEGSSVVLVPLFICLVILITVSLKNMPALFCMLLEGKSGETQNLSWLYTPTSVFQEREHSLQSPSLQSRVVSLHWRKATGWMWGPQYSGWLRCSYPEEQHDCWPHATRNIQSLVALPTEECRRMVVRWLASSVAVGDDLMWKEKNW